MLKWYGCFCYIHYINKKHSVLTFIFFDLQTLPVIDGANEAQVRQPGKEWTFSLNDCGFWKRVSFRFSTLNKSIFFLLFFIWCRWTVISLNDLCLNLESERQNKVSFRYPLILCLKMPYDVDALIRKKWEELSSM